MPRGIIKRNKVVSIFKKEERANNPVAHKGKVRMNISDISEFKKLNKRYGDPSTHLSAQEPPKFIYLKERIQKAQESNVEKRLQKLAKKVGVFNIFDLEEFISKEYPHLIGILLHPTSKYKDFVANNSAFSFRWKYDKSSNTIYMFESKNTYGLNSRNPIYKEAKEKIINSLKEEYPECRTAKRFIVDSEIIDK